jgi:hypothetical protein
MKRTRKFEWTLEADKAFAELKSYLTRPPTRSSSLSGTLK